MRRPESKETRLLNRREFGGLCVALSSFATSSALALDAASERASTGAGRTVKFHDGTVVPVLGQGSGHVGQGRRPAAVEEEALRTGVSLGMELIDTAESYGEGRSEELISHVIAGQRDHVFLVSKVETDHVAGDGIARACEASLARLGTDYLDLYLLHEPVPNTEFSGVVAAFESLRAAGRYAPRACQTSQCDKWKICSKSHKAIAARPIRSLTTSTTAALNMNCCHGASGTACR